MAEVIIDVPTVSGSPGDQAAEWTGVGGDVFITSPTTLVQAGIAVVKTPSGQANQAWVEVVVPGAVAHHLPLCRVNVGDSLDVLVSSNELNDGYDYFNITNLTASCYNSCTVHTTNNQIPDTCGFSGGPGYNSDSASGECIAEKNSPRIAEWNAPGLNWRMHYCNINGQQIGTYSHAWYRIVNSRGQRLVYPGSINSVGSFDQNWVQAA